MNNIIKELAKQVSIHEWPEYKLDVVKVLSAKQLAEFAELIIGKTLDAVRERAYYSGDRAWSDEEDRQWVELEFGIGPLADAQRKTGIK